LNLIETIVLPADFFSSLSSISFGKFAAKDRKLENPNVR